LKKRVVRILLIVLAIIVLAFLINQYFIHFDGEGKKSAEDALPTDQQYEWIKGPKTDNEQRYFYLSNGNYFGTSIVTKNLRGWSLGEGVQSNLPSPLEFNKIAAAYSDSKILFGLIKPDGKVRVTVNDVDAELMQMDLNVDVVDLYNVEGYCIWYVDLSKVKAKKEYIIKIIDSNEDTLYELKI